MTSLTLVTLALVCYGVASRRGYGRAMALGGATPVGAALVVGRIAVPTFYAVALGAVVGLAIRLLARTHRSERLIGPRVPGSVPLILLFVWASLITLAAPLLFDRTAVLAPNGAVQLLSAGVLTSSNIAQLVYLLIGVCVVIFLARSRWAGVGIIGLAAGSATLLSFWLYLGQTYGLPYPHGVFDNSPTFTYIALAPGAIPRFRGIFSEPAGLAMSCLVTVTYMASRAVHTSGLRRMGSLAVLAMAILLGFVSTSATFVVAGAALAVLAGLTLVVGVFRRRGLLRPGVVTVGCAAVVASLWVLPLVANTVGQVIDEKVASSSYVDRSAADAWAYDLFFRTYGLGVGVGSHRPSSFLAALLGGTGAIGTALFGVAVFIVVRGCISVPEYRPAVWTLVGVLITKIVSGPDLADTSGILWLSIGVLAHASLRLRVEEGREVGVQRGAGPLSGARKAGLRASPL